MKIGNLLSTAMLKWLFVFCNFVLVCAPMSVYAQGGEKAPAAIAGKYVIDNTVAVPAGAYTTFSTVYEGKRYYLGIDTTRAKAIPAKDTVTWYDKPNYASMWVVGGLYNPRATSSTDVLPDKNYQRAIESLWIRERCSRKKFLALGDAPTGVTYNPLILRDSSTATPNGNVAIWYTQKDDREQNKYIHGFLYYYSGASGVDFYRYLTFNPLYGFSRAYAARPEESQRISVWDRKTGNDVTCTLTPPGYIFGLNTTEDIQRLTITSHVYYYTNGDRFRSRYDQTDVFVRQPTVYDDQYGLTQEPYYMFGFYEWASNPRPTLPTTPAELAGQDYNGRSLMPVYVDSINRHGTDDESQWTLDSLWTDSMVLWVSDTKYSLDKVKNLWHDTIFAIGKSPFDNPERMEMCRVLRKVDDDTPPVEGAYTPHTDWLRQHFYVKNSSGVYEHFVDSVNIVRRTFHKAPFTTLNTSSSPNDTVLDYSTIELTADFEISAKYKNGYDILYANNTVARRVIENDDDLDLTELTPYTYKDTLYNQLIVEALLIDGTSAIGDGEGQWIKSVSVPSNNVIRVVTKAMTVSDLSNRTAQIRFTYRYRHSMAPGDRAESTRSIWITQKGYSSTSASIYAFDHKEADGTSTDNLQRTHEKSQTFYAIPGQEMQLLLHRDHWGYYRWFIYDADKREKDVVYDGTWTWGSQPTNERDSAFMEINHTSDASSRGRWDVMTDVENPSNPRFTIPHFSTAEPTHIPTIRYGEVNNKHGKIACDVSAYYDIDPTGQVDVNLSAVKEPTISYRQILDIHPAKEQADTLQKYRGNGTGGKWMETHTVVVPAGRPFSLIQRYPVIDSDNVVQRDHLQYIYYFNTGNGGDDMGLKGTLNDTKKDSYSRVGVKRTVELPKRLKLLTKKDLNDMTSGQTKKVILVNPRKTSGHSDYQTSGYAVGRTGDEDIAALDWYSQGRTVNDTSDLRAYLMTSRVLENANCEIVLTKSSTQGYFTLSQNNYPLYSYRRIGKGYIMKWISGDERDVSGGKSIRYDAFTGCEDGDMVDGCKYSYQGNDNSDSCTLFKLHMKWTSSVFSRKGFISAFEWKEPWRKPDHYEPDFNVIDGDGNSGSSPINQGWMIYEIIEYSKTDYEEVPVWEKYNPSTSKWDTVARKGTNNANYRMLEDGNLRISATTHTSAGQTIYYRLRTDHFQLAQFTVVTRDKAKVGPSTSAIISEDSIENHYDILFTLGNENFEAPGTTDVKAYYHTLPWSYTEFSYHYPRTGTGSISDDYRVFKTDLPAAGEYAYLNKFTLNGRTTEAMAGAANGYMLCIHAAQKSTTIFNFTYPKLPCSDQQIYLTFDLANPVSGNAYFPQVTAELQGKVGDGDWTSLHRFKTGGIEHNEGKWQQFVLEIPRESILDKDSFRCVATLNGSTVDNAYVLIDRLRFIAKERPMTVFQNKATCLESEAGGDVHLTARLDYKNLPDLSGKLVAFQYQKKARGGSGFEPLQTDVEAGGTSGAGDIDVYVNDISLTPHTDNTGKSCGVIRIPSTAHMPCNGSSPCDSIVAVTAVTTKKKCYVNEGTDEKKYYVMYLSQQVHALMGDTFRVVMAVIPNAETHPNFSTVGCAAVRTIPIKNPIEIHVSGFDGVWPNYRRDELNGSDAAHTLRTANATYSVTATINDAFLPSGALSGSGKCMFDVVRTDSIDRNMTADEWFKNRFGVTRHQFREIMTIFRADEPGNQMKTETNWNNVRPEYFMYDKRYSKEQADSIYAVLNHLIVDLGYVEIGVSSYDIYMADNNNSYAVFWPIPASGTYVDAETRETREITVCATPRWFEIHSDKSDYHLRFGYDNLQPGNYYMTPVIRATAAEANSSLKVRIADITHTEHAGVVIGWDSTYVIDSNDPEWNPATKTFRYHQDRIVQERIFDEYYKAPSKESTIDNRYVTFTPVTSEYIAQLQATDCKCYNYDASKTTWDASGTGDDNVLIKQSDSGCNKWGVKYIAEGGATRTGTADHNMPGYQVANNITLKAGYWYKFKTSFFDVSSIVYYNEGGDGTCRGNSEFILAIAPDKVQWTPSHPDGINYWNDDNNWTPVMVSAPADGFKAKVPMGETQVIIPEMAAANTLPIVNNTVPRRIDTLDYGFKKNTCKDILFKPRATMLGQEQLEYQRAFVDVPLATAEYMTFSPALKYIYAGDMYIPKVADNVDFDPKEFKDPSTSYSAEYNRKTPYAMYAAYYNQTVPFAYYNTDTEGNELSYKSRSSADWVFTNTMKMPLTPGTACLLLAYDKTGEDKDSVIVRLPKKETHYPYIGKKPDGSWGTGSDETMEGKPAFEDLSNNLAFNKTDLASARTSASNPSAGITYTLTNETPSKVFFFGNPTMALIDVYKLCQDNSSKLDKGGTGTSYYFTAYHLREGEASYSTRVITGPGQFFVAPQRSVGLIAASAGTELEVELRPEALVAMADGSAISIDTISFSAPVRRAAYQEPSPVNWLYMSAANETDGGLCKAYLTIGQFAMASRNYVAGEDALNLSSGTSNNVAYETPLSMYTIAGNEALMLDVRDSIGTIPLVFATLPDYEYEEYTLLSFAFEGHWSTPLYLYDALTNDSIQITNGLQVAVRTPESDQIRYFINGNGARTSTDGGQPGVTTDIDEVDDQLPTANNKSAIIYDVLGRPVLKLSEHDLISNIQLPTGVYIIQRGKNTERMVIR